MALDLEIVSPERLLLSRPVEQAGEFLEVKRTGEIQRVVEAFLMHHFQRFRGLRSLELLRALPGAADADEPGGRV